MVCCCDAGSGLGNSAAQRNSRKFAFANFPRSVAAYMHPQCPPRRYAATVIQCPPRVLSPTKAGNRVRQSEKRFPLFESVLNFELAHPERFLKFPNGDTSLGTLKLREPPLLARATRSRSRDFAITRIRRISKRGGSRFPPSSRRTVATPRSGGSFA